jgi:hypothetical protein
VAIFNNTVYVAGNFTTAGGTAATNFAIWNGLAWAGTGLGLSSSAYKVIATATNLYVGGAFFVAGGGIVNQVASWNGSQWEPIGPFGRIEGLSSTVRALTTDGTNLYAGGSFTFAGRTNATRVGRFDGTNWASIGNGLNATVRALALAGTNLYAGGDFTASSGGPTVSRVAQWNGETWVKLTNLSATVVNALAVRGTDLFIAGYISYTAADGFGYNLFRWDGTNMWRGLLFNSNTLNQFYIDNIGFVALAVDGPKVYVSGRCNISECDEFFVNCTNCANVMYFDGVYTHGLGSGLSSNANAIAVLGTNVYFGGPCTNAGGLSVRGIARWNGSEWSDVGGGVVGNGIISALAVVGSNLYAGGSFTNIGGEPANRIARWNGTTWSALGSGSSGTILTITAVGEDLYVGGSFRTAGGKPANFLARWNETMDFTDVSLVLDQMRQNDVGNLQFTLTSIGVPTYVIDTSSNLIQWTPVLTNTLTPFDYSETNSFPRRFYRARSLP